MALEIRSFFEDFRDRFSGAFFHRFWPHLGSIFELFFALFRCFSACFLEGPGGGYFGPGWRRSEPERGHGLVKFS